MSVQAESHYLLCICFVPYSSLGDENDLVYKAKEYMFLGSTITQQNPVLRETFEIDTS